MTQLQKLFAVFVAICGAIAVAIYDRSPGLTLITFNSIVTLFIGMALTAENK